MRLCDANVRNVSVRSGANNNPADFHPVLAIESLNMGVLFVILWIHKLYC